MTLVKIYLFPYHVRSQQHSVFFTIFFGLDNWALLYAQRMALKQEVPLFVCFCLPSKFLNTTYRQYSFMIKGLQEVEKVQ